MYFKKLCPLFCAQRRYYSSIEKINIKRLVYVSQSQDVFTNLALEDWIYNKCDFTDCQILMLWQNNPCVVIGRHQNPWLEVDLKQLNEDGLTLARRNSGGGAVYHDCGNLNFTFFTCRKYYNRKYNMEFISNVIRKKFDVTLNVSPKYDLFSSDSKKVSGTAAKLGRTNTYHHCTLLVNVNKLKLNQLLAHRETNINTNATASIRSSVMNLCDEIKDIKIDSIIQAIGMEYLKSSAMYTNETIQSINPTNESYPGINEIRNNLMTWEWQFGKTPKFNVQINVNSSHILTGNIVVINGLISEVFVILSPNLCMSNNEMKLSTNFDGCKFSNEIIENLKLYLSNIDESMLVQSKANIGIV